MGACISIVSQCGINPIADIAKAHALNGALVGPCVQQAVVAFGLTWAAWETMRRLQSVRSWNDTLLQLCIAYSCHSLHLIEAFLTQLAKVATLLWFYFQATLSKPFAWLTSYAPSQLHLKLHTPTAPCTLGPIAIARCMRLKTPSVSSHIVPKF